VNRLNKKSNICTIIFLCLVLAISNIAIMTFGMSRGYGNDGNNGVLSTSMPVNTNAIDVSPSHGFVGGSGGNEWSDSKGINYYPYSRAAFGAKFKDKMPNGSSSSWDTINNLYGGSQSQPQAANESQKGWPASGAGTVSDDMMAGKGGWEGKLDEYGKDRWPKNNIDSGEVTITWAFTARHTTAKYEYWITKPGWSDDGYHIDKNDFERIAFFDIDSAADQKRPDIHRFTIPSDRKGYHLMMAIWEIYDTAASFYNVLDLDIASGKENGSITWVDGQTYSKAQTGGLEQNGTADNPVQYSDPQNTWPAPGPKPGGVGIITNKNLDTPAGLRYDYTNDKLMWNAVPNAKDYKIKMYPTDRPMDTAISRTNHPDNVFTAADGLSGLVKDTQYTLEVTANANGDWKESETTTRTFVYGKENGQLGGGGDNGNSGGGDGGNGGGTTPEGGKLATPTNLAYSQSNDTLSWNVVANAHDYKVKIYPTDHPENTAISRAGHPSNIFTGSDGLSGLTKNQQYALEVVANPHGNYVESDAGRMTFVYGGGDSSGGGGSGGGDQGNGGGSGGGDTKPPEGGQLSKPIGIAFSKNFGTISWSSVPHAEKYKVLVYITAAGASGAILNISSHPTSLVSADDGLNQSIMTAGTNYTIEVSANATGSWTESPIGRGTFVYGDSNQDIQNRLQQPSGINFDKNSKKISWQSVPNATHYVVIVTNNDSKQISLQNATTVEEIDFSHLKAGNYTVQIVAMGDETYGESNMTSFSFKVEGSGGSSTWLILTIIAVVLLLAAGGVFFFMKKKNASPPSGSARPMMNTRPSSSRPGISSRPGSSNRIPPRK